jgi:hypothetical protein
MMRTHQRSTFPTVTSEGALLPVDVLLRIAQCESSLGGMSAEDYRLNDKKLNEVINDTWLRLLRAWEIFQAACAKLPANDTGTTLTRERWLLTLFTELGYGRLFSTMPLEIEGKSYPISYGWQHVPIHLVSYKLGLNQLARSMMSGSRHSPASLVQEVVNRSSEHLWGMVSNGLSLRLLRRNVSLTRQAYVEFDLQAMMQGESYADFVLFWLLCHQSRVEAERATDCWIEKWSRLAHEQGIRLRGQLRQGVEEAINVLGSGLLAHPANQALRQKLRTGKLCRQDYYRQVLRLVYRMLILFVAEDRGVLFHPQADEQAQSRYRTYYSTARLRRLAGQRIGTRHSDLFQALSLVMEQLGNDTGCPALGLPALNGFLFSQQAIPDLAGCELANHELLRAVRSLAFTTDGPIYRSVDYKNLGSEELGSIYESLLELHPELNVEAATFVLKKVHGNERKTSGSYYTPASLVDCLLNSALEPVLVEACAKPDPEKAILALKVCDPACGSGHFLIAAAHRIAKCLAAVRTGSEEPGLAARRAALRDVVGHCIYGVDINPMAVELCKVNLWMEAIEPGKPLSFLDAHIQCGNSLLGATPALLKQGIPDSAFKPIGKDDKKLCSEYKKKNKEQRTTGQRSMFTQDLQPWDRLGDLAASIMQMENMRDNTIEEIHRKQNSYAQAVTSSDYLNGRLWADAWCAAFVWKKTQDFPYPFTEEIFRRIEQNPYSIVPWMKDEIQRLAQQYWFFHWHLAFPDVFRIPAKNEEPENEQAGWSGGFDVVLGNTPWERIKIQEKEWFASCQPDIAHAVNAAQREKLIETLVHESPELYKTFREDQRQAAGKSHLIRNSGRYALCGRGDVNTYAIFAEHMRLIVKPTGCVGCIVPSGIATDDTTKFFFQDLMETRSLVSLYDLENRDGIFPGVHRSYKFCLLTLTGLAHPTTKGANFVFFAHKVEDLQDEQRRLILSASDTKLFNPNTRTCPIFRSKRDMELTKAVYERVPILIKEGPPEENPWGIKFSMMFDMANDSHLFRSREQLEQGGWVLKGNVFYKDGERCLPLYEGKMIWHFDHRFSGYEDSPQETRELDSVEHNNPHKCPLPRYWVHESCLQDRIKIGTNMFVAFRGITHSINARTAIFSIIPPFPCGNNLPLTITDFRYIRELLFLSASTSSFVFDYVARQKVGGANMNFFIVKQLPVLPPQQYITTCKWNTEVSLGDWIFPRALELTYTAWDLEPFAKDCGYNGPPFRWDEERRFLLRCELDAAYFHLYGIACDDVDYIMDTFRVWREKEEKLYGEYRTKRVILEMYDEMWRAMEVGERYRGRVELSAAGGVVHAGDSFEAYE